MYQALYRKYRPSTFNEVVGQDIIVKTLKNAIIHEETSHAYLFTGPRGTGKTSVAKIFAKTINCIDTKNGIPCDLCLNCLQFNEKQMTDIIEIDAASNNGVDEIRELKSKIGLVPANSKYKVYIIDEVHMLTTGAFNALLKTLEEPPKHIIFILATTEPHKIPATILSRCQRFDFKKISTQKMVERLNIIVEQENIKIEPLAISEIARLSDGGMRDSISMLDQVRSYSDDQITAEDVHGVNGTLTQNDLKLLIKRMIESNIESCFNILDEYSSNGKNMIKLTEEIMLFLRNILLLSIVPNYSKENSESETYQELVSMINTDYILKYIKILNQSLNEMKNSSNPKMLLELAMIEMLENKTVGNKNIQNIENNEIKILYSSQEENVPKLEIKNEKDEPLPEPAKFDDQPETTEHSISIQNETPTLSLTSYLLDAEQHEKLKQLAIIRINNTLTKFDKKRLGEIKIKIENIRRLLLNPEYSDYVSMILDGELKAASTDHLIFIYPTINESNLFNENILNVELLLNLVLESHYFVVATDQDNWNQIKQQFNQKQKEYTYIEENINLKEIFENEENHDSMKKIFGNIVEYN